MSLQHWLLRLRGNDEALERGRRGPGGKGRASVRKLMERCEKRKRQVYECRNPIKVITRYKNIHGDVCVTEIDCPNRLRAAVFIGVMTPVRLLDFATGLTFLLLGS